MSAARYVRGQAGCDGTTIGWSWECGGARRGRSRSSRTRGWSNPRLQALVDQLGNATAEAKCLADELDELVVHLRYPTRPGTAAVGAAQICSAVARRGQTPHQGDLPLPWRGQLPHRGMSRPRPHHRQRDQRHSVYADRRPAPRPHPLTGRRAVHPRGGDSRPDSTKREPETAAYLQHQWEAPRFAGEQRARTDPHAASRARDALTAQVARSRGRGIVSRGSLNLPAPPRDSREPASVPGRRVRPAVEVGKAPRRRRASLRRPRAARPAGSRDRAVRPAVGAAALHQPNRQQRKRQQRNHSADRTERLDGGRGDRGDGAGRHDDGGQIGASSRPVAGTTARAGAGHRGERLGLLGDCQQFAATGRVGQRVVDPIPGGVLVPGHHLQAGAVVVELVDALARAKHLVGFGNSGASVQVVPCTS